jgi:hypothetical protein
VAPGDLTGGRFEMAELDRTEKFGRWGGEIDLPGA